MKPPSKDELKRVSVHEAGHFIIGRLIGFEATGMALVDKGDGIFSGCVTWRASRADQLLAAEREGSPLESLRERWGVSAQEFDRLCRVLAARKNSLVRKLMARVLAGVAADTELGGSDGTIGESDYLMARELARAIVPESHVGALMDAVIKDVRWQAAGPLRAAILATAERLRQRRHFDAEALNDLWDEVKSREGWAGVME